MSQITRFVLSGAQLHGIAGYQKGQVSLMPSDQCKWKGGTDPVQSILRGGRLLGDLTWWLDLSKPRFKSQYLRACSDTISPGVLNSEKSLKYSDMAFKVLENGGARTEFKWGMSSPPIDPINYIHSSREAISHWLCQHKIIYCAILLIISAAYLLDITETSTKCKNARWNDNEVFQVMCYDFPYHLSFPTIPLSSSSFLTTPIFCLLFFSLDPYCCLLFSQPLSFASFLPMTSFLHH